MTFLIDNHATLEYLTDTGQRTKNPRKGRRFPASTNALRIAKAEPIGKLNIVCHIPATNQFVNRDHGRGKGAALEEVRPTTSWSVGSARRATLSQREFTSEKQFITAAGCCRRGL